MNLEILIENFIINYGVFSIFLIVALEYANAPLPSEIVLPLAGIMASQYGMNIYLVIFVSILGGVIGSLTNYYLGYKLGNPLLYTLKTKYPKTQNAIKESNKWMDKYNKASVMLSRLVPLARTFISIVAGVNKMNIYTFTLYSTIGISVWNILLILIGYVVGDNMHKITAILSTYSKFIIVILLFAIVAFCFIKLKKSKNTSSQDKKA